MNKVFIVTMLFNRQPYAKVYLENLFNYTDEPFDLILWDNGSQAPMQRLLDKVENLKFKNGSTVTIIRNKTNEGVGATLHHAQKLRKPHQHFMQLDADVIVPKDSKWLNKLIHIIEKNTENIEVIGFPQYNPKHFYDNYPGHIIYIDNVSYCVHDTADILGCCFLGHQKLFSKFNYPHSKKKYGEGCDLALITYARNNNTKMAYIRPASMVEFLDDIFVCKENGEYLKWKTETISNPRFFEDFKPTEVGDDDSELNIYKHLLA